MASLEPRRTTSPFLTQFISDFTLGFSDGLTVPFALTAGLSSLGKTDTVIYAGMAELCAGSISMGIGGFLSARDAVPDRSSPAPAKPADEEVPADADEKRHMLADEPASPTGSVHSDTASDHDCYSLEGYEGDRIIRSYLGPLGLEPEELERLVSTIATRGHTHRTARRIQCTMEAASAGAESDTETAANTPLMSGLSIALGYLMGGLIPMLPYFFAPTVGLGLVWSIFLCMIALFSYGAGKNYLLGGSRRPAISKCLWEGLHMLLLGGVAAGTAVLCVHLVENAQSS
ncbi:hypothetical protein TD95_002167 [Thielaviopsis punctulata]|uniref:Vacuolar iron transporter Ccc1 n=1 Tax=Thielaviopsis punctulata TaxID=72032 RepID=A0A0F4Z603_9PEZI|nr:hypothetical protein TD95_002167 [Thielaviopsis punctulata]